MAVTLRELYEELWSTRDRPKVSEPYRAPIIARAEWVNEHGVLIRAQVITNRTGSRWWLKFLTGDSGYMSKYLTTTSKTKAEGWMRAVVSGWGSGGSGDGAVQRNRNGAGLMKFVVFSQSGLPIGTIQSRDKESAESLLLTHSRRFGSSTSSHLYLYPYLAAGRDIRSLADRGVVIEQGDG
jgi:hypothetical protein